MTQNVTCYPSLPSRTGFLAQISMKYFTYSIGITLLCLVLAFAWGGGLTSPQGGLTAMVLALILGIMEVSLSFENAVANALVLKTMNARWQKLFLTVGMVIAVFGMRLVFPILIVAMATGQSLHTVALMAFQHPEEYSRYLEQSHTYISAFGGTFLFLVFLHFMLDDAKERHWIAVIEKRLMKLGKLDSVQAMLSLVLLLILYRFLPLGEVERVSMLVAGISGIVLYILVSSFDVFLMDEEKTPDDSVIGPAQRAGIIGFIYLEVLDASFSFDGVIGAFAVTRDLVIIILGLSIGAMFVRSLTVFMVEKGTLDAYVYLEHGAHWAIGILAGIMLAGISVHIPEIITGLSGVIVILVSLISSESYRLAQLKQPSGILVSCGSLLGLRGNKKST